MPRRSIDLLPTVTACALLGLLSAPSRADDWAKTYEISHAPTVTVHTDDGRVRVTIGDDRQVRAQVHTEGWKIQPGQITIEESQRGDHVELIVREPHLRFDLFTGPRRIVVNLVVPRSLQLEVTTGDGSVSLPGLVGPVTVRTGDGDIVADSLRGAVRLSTGDGDVRVTTMDGGLLAHTGDGRITVAGRFDALDASSGDGTLEVDALPGSTAGSGWDLTTGDGNIALRVPREFRMELMAHTGDGRIDVDIPLLVSGHLSAHTVNGTANGGGGTVRMKSGDGHIRVTAL